MMEIVKTRESYLRRRTKYTYRLTGSASEVTNWLNDVAFDLRLSVNGNIMFGDGDRAHYVRWCQDDTWQIDVERAAASQKLIDAFEKTMENSQ